MRLTSLEKSLRVIDILSLHPAGLALAEMSRRLGLPKSSVHHILSTFQFSDYVVQDRETKKYSLGFKFLEISRRILDNLDVRRVAHPYLVRLREKCEAASHLAVLREGRVVYIDKVEPPMGLTLATYVGFSTDPHAAAGGKVLLAALDPDEVREIYAHRELKAYGKNTITDMDALLAELEKIAQEGYAIDDEEYYEGVRCVAAPVRAGGRVVAALSLTGSIFTMTEERIKGELKDLVVETAAAISEKMAW